MMSQIKWTNVWFFKMPKQASHHIMSSNNSLFQLYTQGLEKWPTVYTPDAQLTYCEQAININTEFLKCLSIPLSLVQGSLKQMIVDPSGEGLGELLQ